MQSIQNSHFKIAGYNIPKRYVYVGSLIAIGIIATIVISSVTLKTDKAIGKFTPNTGKWTLVGLGAAIGVSGVIGRIIYSKKTNKPKDSETQDTENSDEATKTPITENSDEADIEKHDNENLMHEKVADSKTHAERRELLGLKPEDFPKSAEIFEKNFCTSSGIVTYFLYRDQSVLTFDEQLQYYLLKNNLIEKPEQYFYFPKDQLNNLIMIMKTEILINLSLKSRIF